MQLSTQFLNTAKIKVLIQKKKKLVGYQSFVVNAPIYMNLLYYHQMIRIMYNHI